ncbi:MAG: hypothetical protein LBS81_03660 [Endomicrobium sp.]|jgi:hypothetical protein|nr:hypothetical protein [Endomicrobium sp.]
MKVLEAGRYEQDGKLSVDLFAEERNLIKSVDGETSFYISDTIKVKGDVILSSSSSKLYVNFASKEAYDDSVTRAYTAYKLRR